MEKIGYLQYIIDSIVVGVLRMIKKVSDKYINKILGSHRLHKIRTKLYFKKKKKTKHKYMEYHNHKFFSLEILSKEANNNDND